MKSTISLKKLRTDPRALVDLLNRGHEVTITEHRRPLARAKTPKVAKKPKRGDIGAFLKYVETMPKHPDLYPDVPTPELLRRAKDEHFAKKHDLKQR